MVGLALALLTGGIRGEHRRHVTFGQRRTLVQRHVDDGRLEGSSAAGRLRERLLLGLLELLQGSEQSNLSAFLASGGWLGALLEQVDRLAGSLREVRHFGELLLPLIGDSNRALLGVGRLRGPPHLVGVEHDFLEIIWVQGVQNGEEIIARGALSILEGIRKVFGELGVILVLRPELSH